VFGLETLAEMLWGATDTATGDIPKPGWAIEAVEHRHAKRREQPARQPRQRLCRSDPRDRHGTGMRR
jgi:hypothetical protein